MSSPTTFKFDEKLTATLDSLKDATGASSKAEIVRRAIALFKVVQEAQQAGERVILRSPENAEGQATERVVVLS